MALARWVSCLFLITSLALGSLLFTHETALGHAEVQSSTPANGSTTGAGITTVTITFTEEVSLDQSTAELSLDRGPALPGVTSAVDRADRKKMTLTAPPLEPGSYVVTWKAVTEDDNAITSGTFSFTVTADDTPGATPTSPAMPTAPATPTPAPSPTQVPTTTATPLATPTITMMPTATATFGSAGEGANDTPALGMILAVAVAVALVAALLVLQRRAAK